MKVRNHWLPIGLVMVGLALAVWACALPITPGPGGRDIVEPRDLPTETPTPWVTAYAVTPLPTGVYAYDLSPGLGYEACSDMVGIVTPSSNYVYYDIATWEWAQGATLLVCNTNAYPVSCEVKGSTTWHTEINENGAWVEYWATNVTPTVYVHMTPSDYGYACDSSGWGGTFTVAGTVTSLSPYATAELKVNAGAGLYGAGNPFDNPEHPCYGEENYAYTITSVNCTAPTPTATPIPVTCNVSEIFGLPGAGAACQEYNGRGGCGSNDDFVEWYCNGMVNAAGYTVVVDEAGCTWTAPLNSVIKDWKVSWWDEFRTSAGVRCGVTPMPTAATVKLYSAAGDLLDTKLYTGTLLDAGLSWAAITSTLPSGAWSTVTPSPGR